PSRATKRQRASTPLPPRAKSSSALPPFSASRRGLRTISANLTPRCSPPIKRCLLSMGWPKSLRFSRKRRLSGRKTMTLGELLGRGVELPSDLATIPIARLAADSREVKPGFLFAALPGVKTDGARFIQDALQRGAAAVLVAEGAAPPTASAAIIEDSDPRRRLALIASRFFGAQPETPVAVTGTNGKTSVASFVRQLWAGLGLQAASLGTVGVVGPRGTEVLKHTTPDPIELHRILSAPCRDGLTHLALEASIHGLQQRRVDGVTLAAGAFTNISRDHLDYHASFEEYFPPQRRLFSELLPRGGR